MYWFKCMRLSRERCRGTLQSHNNSEEGNKKLTKTEPKQICLQLLPKGGEGWNGSDDRKGIRPVEKLDVGLSVVTIWLGRFALFFYSNKSKTFVYMWLYDLVTLTWTVSFVVHDAGNTGGDQGPWQEHLVRLAGTKSVLAWRVWRSSSAERRHEVWPLSSWHANKCRPRASDVRQIWLHTRRPHSPVVDVLNCLISIVLFCRRLYVLPQRRFQRCCKHTTVVGINKR